MTENLNLITGGLGNQLFQLAANLTNSETDNVRLLALGDERQYVPGRADISGFALSERVILYQPRPNFNIRILRRLLGNIQTRAIATGTDHSKRAWLVNRMTGMFARIGLSLAGTTARQVYASPVIGFDSSAQSVPSNSLLLGFFQSWRYIDRKQILSILGGPSLASPCEWHEEMTERALRERPLIVHVRLGDYRTIAGVGIPDLDYYSRAIEQAVEKSRPGAIWLFSDEPELAKDLVPSCVNELTVEIVSPPPGCEHPAASMLVMASGVGFVIGNSTFGYWAATLSEAAGDRVFVPDPWFPLGPSIRDLVPASWIRISRLPDH